MHKPAKVDMVARCLASLDGKFISASDWRGRVGLLYRIKATAVLQAIDNFDKGNKTGGLPR